MVLFEDFSGKIIWSADGVTLSELLAIIEGDFPRGAVAVKLDRLFLTRFGLSAITEVQNRGVPVFADAKIIEIPSKVQEIAKLHLEHQPWMLNAMAGICDNGAAPGRPSDSAADEIYQFAELCASAGTKSCVVTVLTSKQPQLIEWEFSRRDASVQVSFYAQLAIDCGVSDIVCSPQEVAEVRRLKKINVDTGEWQPNGIEINTPGVRLPGSSKDDQARVMTPCQALASGANRLVIGRDLSRDGKFSQNFAKIMANIEGGD